MAVWQERKPFVLPGPRGERVTGRCFQKQVEDGHLSVMVGQEPVGGKLQWHLSISHRSNVLLNTHGAPLAGRIPTWDEIRDARYEFCPDNVYMAMILPPKSEYVNLHPTTMHLHEVPGDA